MAGPRFVTRKVTCRPASATSGCGALRLSMRLHNAVVAAGLVPAFLGEANPASRTFGEPWFLAAREFHRPPPAAAAWSMPARFRSPDVATAPCRAGREARARRNYSRHVDAAAAHAADSLIRHAAAAHGEAPARRHPAPRREHRAGRVLRSVDLSPPGPPWRRPGRYGITGNTMCEGCDASW